MYLLICTIKLMNSNDYDLEALYYFLNQLTAIQWPIPLLIEQHITFLRFILLNMGFSVLPCLIVTVFWGLVGIVLPIFLPKGNNRGLIQLSLVLTAATCWLFWLCAYMAQMNPLIGPKLKYTTILMMAQEWGNPIVDLPA